jgi:hypothetical protein
MHLRRRTTALTVYVLGLCAVALTVALALAAGRPVDHFTRDPLSVMNGPFYIGLLSNLTAAAWFAAAGACWSVALVHVLHGLRGRAMAMMAAAAVITLLGADDLFMIHDEALQRHAGISERLTMLVYFALAVVVALAGRRQWISTPWRLMIPAGAFFAASIAVDQLTAGWGWRLVIEDSLKFLGVVGVLAWSIGTAQAWLTPQIK